jgi:biotin operon repressor
MVEIYRKGHTGDVTSYSTTLSTLKEPSSQVYAPTVEHPLLSIQDKMSKLEEIYRRLEEKVATRQDIAELRELMREGVSKEDSIIRGIEGIDRKIMELHQRKEVLAKKIDVSGEELVKVEKELEVLEADKKIINLLSEGDYSTIEIAAKIGYTRQYIWGRLRAMEEGGKVQSLKVGRQTKYKLLSKT